MEFEEIIVLVVTVLVVIGFVIIGIGFGWNGIHINTGNGHQIGYVSAVETNGWIFKTKRVYIKPEMESTQEDTYCLIDKELESLLLEAGAKKQKIETEYMSYLLPSFRECRGENAIITGFIIK